MLTCRLKVVDDVVDTAGATHLDMRTIASDVGDLITGTSIDDSIAGVSKGTYLTNVSGFGDLLDDAEDAVNEDLSKLGDFSIA